MRKIIVHVRISRYQLDKTLGEEYRAQQNVGETFTEFKARKKREAKQKEEESKVKIVANSEENMASATNMESTVKKFQKKKHTPRDISKFH